MKSRVARIHRVLYLLSLVMLNFLGISGTVDVITHQKGEYAFTVSETVAVVVVFGGMSLFFAAAAKAAEQGSHQDSEKNEDRPWRSRR
ncbi:hypothetical protein [Streptomyces rhizosphaericus]|uniref:Uncharacterized protein n=1 Tax=Streptomyces rhizosphaericus TaxID=114699 RepID=A0A6G4AQX8_9ACTN|nr:hypothetical protein [Streptomyces rhizosphaericus]NEW74991.1 hypothetical protein [Streptomyces rhizosphaericus]